MENTLDPPGTIAVLGAGPVGIEAALYARYLGYDVTLFESAQPLSQLRDRLSEPPPQACSSPLGRAALAAQRGGGGTMVEIEPENLGEWLEQYFLPLLETDLLSGRVRAGCRVTELVLAAMDADDAADAANNSEGELEIEAEEDASDEEIPPDFIVRYQSADGTALEQRFEAVIDARGCNADWIGPGPAIATASELPAYYYWLGKKLAADCTYESGLEQIPPLFADLSGRGSLNVYRNLGG